jgi:hypothetical protein
MNSSFPSDGDAADSARASEESKPVVAAAPASLKRIYQPVARETRPEDWTPARHPQWARRHEVARYKNVSLFAVDACIKSGRYAAVKDGASVLIWTDSVFEDDARLLQQASLPAPASAQAPTGRKRGRRKGSRNRPRAA